MSILIKMEMPKNCVECPCCENTFYQCNINGARFFKVRDAYEKRHPDCPLIEIPDVYIDISKAFMTELCNKVCTDTPVAPLHLPHEEEKDE